jgi:hypothetical protein
MQQKILVLVDELVICEINSKYRTVQGPCLVLYFPKNFKPKYLLDNHTWCYPKVPEIGMPRAVQ